MKNFFAAASVMVSMATYAQKVQKCATTEIIREMEKKHPGYLQLVSHAFEQAKNLARLKDAPRSGVVDTVYRIRTVFHVVYTKPEENLDDSVILSQLRVLNEDFRRLNADTSNTREIFKPFAGDAGIEFGLADTDPDGNFTTGITHTAGNPAPSFFGGFSPATDDVKRAASGGVDPWPTDRYLNIWVCNLFGGLGVLGYAYPPAAPLANWGTQNPNADSAKQGVVLHFSAVGSNNPASIAPQADGGRSATHEIGHYLGLRHIWGDDQDFFGINCRCAGDPNGGNDGIDDTPDAKCASQQDCDTARNTCPDPDMDQDYPDQIENFMDYSDDNCLNMFTNGQIALMRSVIELYRPGIATKVFNTTSSIKSVSFSEAVMSAFPNPVSSKLNLVLNKPVLNGTIQIFNSQGMMVWSKIINESTALVEVSEFPAGIYLVMLQSENLKTSTRFIKN